MKKYLSLVAIILGLLSNLLFFNSDLNLLFDSLMPIFAVGVVGAIFAILSLTKYKEDNKKIFSIIGLILSILPMVYYAPTFILVL